MTFQNPVIVVPGITASELRDEYPLDPETVWSLLPFGRNFHRISLHPDNLNYERDEPARVRVDRLFKIPYGELIDSLRHELTLKADRPTPVYPFAYDWRMPLETAAKQLGELVTEVIKRTCLMRHYYEQKYEDSPRVDLVGHSMGGLIIAGYLKNAGSAASIGKVVTLGTPFFGSFESVMKVTTGLSTLSADPPRSPERESARVTPSLYHLLPRFEGAVTSNGKDVDLFAPDTWQTTVIQTLAEYFRLYGKTAESDETVLTNRAIALLDKMLSVARDYLAGVDSLDLTACNLTSRSWLCVVGIGQETRVRLEVEGMPKQPHFVLDSRKDRKGDWSKRKPAKNVQTGDGTVPYLGAKPRFIPIEQLVCVSPKEFGYWEIGDRLLNAAIGLHGMLPKMNRVHRLVASHLLGLKNEELRDLKARPAPDLPAGVKWAPPIEGLETEGG